MGLAKEKGKEREGSAAINDVTLGAQLSVTSEEVLEWVAIDFSRSGHHSY